jgi:shikimate dehydrogenase
VNDSADLHAAERTHGPLVVSIVARDAAELRARALAAAPGADLVELRLDGVEFGSLEPAGPELEVHSANVERFLADLVRALERPVIATVHPGPGLLHDSATSRDHAAARIALLVSAARAGVTYVDLDLALVAHGELTRLLPERTRRVLSVHSDTAPQSHTELDTLAAPLFRAARPGDIVKVVPRAERAEDMLLVLAWLGRRSAALATATDTSSGLGLAAFVTSKHAPLVSLASRLLAPTFGATLVYAAPDDGGTLAAPGQPRAAELRAAWPTTGPRVTQLFGIAGRPLAHSASPRVHGAAQRALGLDALFVPLESEHFEQLLARLDDPRWRGLSVTAPFKADALRLAASADEDTHTIAAANTLVRRVDGRWDASNTDAPAVLVALGGAAMVRGRRVLVVGAGGAARAAAHALSRAGAAVSVAARDVAAARALAAEVSGAALDLATSAARFAEPSAEPHYAFVVHATPVGTDGRGSAPVPCGLLRPGVTVLDAVYRPRRTALVRRAEAEGATAVLGEAWFLAQAATQFARFHGLAEPLAPEARVALAAAFTVAGRAGPRADRSATHAPSIVLIGLRCAGKSTLAVGLAAALGGSALDLDVELARRFVPRTPAEAPLVGRTAGELLAALGEPRFRAEESAALAALLDPQRRAAEREPPRTDPCRVDRARDADGPVVLATGGGVVESAEGRDLLASLAGRATVIWLDAPPAVLARRLAASTEPRPSLTGAPPATEVELLHARRGPWYRALSDVVIDASLPLDTVLANALAALP